MSEWSSARYSQEFGQSHRLAFVEECSTKAGGAVYCDSAGVDWLLKAESMISSKHISQLNFVGSASPFKCEAAVETT